MIAFEQRASTVLFNLIRSCPVAGPFLLPANICPVVPMVFFKARRPFEFIDISLDTLCMDHEAIIDRWSRPNDTPAGLVYVRTYGAVFEADDVFTMIKSLSPDALIVDDRCLCPPDFSGTLSLHADATIYSTGYAKFVDIGFGGFGVFRDGVPYARTESTFNGGDLDEVNKQYKDALRTQTNFSYQDSDWLDTTMPPKTWETYQEWVERDFVRVSAEKIATNSIYSSRLPPEIQFPSVFQSWRFNIQVKDKETVLNAIRREGLFASGHYDSLAGLFGPGSAPSAQTLHRHVINLFNDRYFSTDQVIEVTDFLANLKPLPPGPLFS